MSGFADPTASKVEWIYELLLCNAEHAVHARPCTIVLLVHLDASENP